MCQRYRNAPAAGADVKNPSYSAGAYPWRKPLLDPLGQRRARYQDALVDLESVPGKPCLSRDVGCRTALFNSHREHVEQLFLSSWGRGFVEQLFRVVERQTQCMKDEHDRFVRCVVSTVAVEKLVASKLSRDPVDQLHRCFQFEKSMPSIVGNSA